MKSSPSDLKDVAWTENNFDSAWQYKEKWRVGNFALPACLRKRNTFWKRKAFGNRSEQRCLPAPWSSDLYTSFHRLWKITWGCSYVMSMVSMRTKENYCLPNILIWYKKYPKYWFTFLKFAILFPNNESCTHLNCCKFEQRGIFGSKTQRSHFVRHPMWREPYS